MTACKKGIALLCFLLSTPAGQALAASNQKAGQEGEETAYQGREVVRREQARQWASRIALPLPDDYCVAYERFTGSCLLNVMEFNLSVNPLNRRAIEDSEALLSQREVFRTRKAILEGLSEGIFMRDLLKNRQDRRLQGEIDLAWSKHLAESARGFEAQALKRLYARHYDALFAAQHDVEVRLLGSSDSLFLDSLAHFPMDSGSPFPRTVRPAMEDSAASRELRYSWQPLSWKALPEGLKEWTKSTVTGAQSPILHTEFGWFILKISKSTPVPAKTFSQALPVLLAIAALPADPREYQDAAKPAPAESDHREIRLWLLPPARIRGRAAIMPAWADTARLAPMQTRISRLPGTVREKAVAILSQSGSGILKSDYGIWYLKLAPGTPRALARTEARGVRETVAHSKSPTDLGLRLALENAAQLETDFRIDFLRSRIADSCSADSEFRLAQAPGNAAKRLPADPFTFASKKWVEQNMVVQDDLLKP
ncbi:MAG TPA: hypothetical protein VJ385_14415 [Fibrobacteria bacterium]|nr:hypothetical protein [Fibrobacteria bacterium]